MRAAVNEHDVKGRTALRLRDVASRALDPFSRSSETDTARTALVICSIVLISTALGVTMLTRDHAWGDDFAEYLLQATAIVHGKPSESAARMAFAMRGSSHLVGPLATPWGFPALLAPMYVACGGINIVCLKRINVLLFGLSLVAFFSYVRRRQSLVDSALIVSMLALSPVLLQFENELLPDIPFLFFSTLAIVLIDSTVVGRKKSAGSPVRQLWLGLALFAAFAVRTNGVLLVATLALTELAGGRRRPALIPYAVFCALAVAVLIALPSGEASSMAFFRPFSLATVRDNVSAYAILPSVFFWTLPMYEVAYGALLLFMASGAVLHYKQDFAALVYSGLTILLLVVWPYQQGLRYVYPIMPFAVYFCWCGMQATAFGLTDRHRRAGDLLTRGVWVAILISFALTSVRFARANMRPHRDADDGPFSPSSTAMFTFVRTSTEPGATIAFEKPRLMALMTERNALLIDRCDQLSKGNYVVIRKVADPVEKGEKVEPPDQVPPDQVGACNPTVTVTPVFENARFVVYRIGPRRTDAHVVSARSGSSVSSAPPSR